MKRINSKGNKSDMVMSCSHLIEGLLLNRRTPFLKGDRTILKESPPLKVYFSP